MPVVTIAPPVWHYFTVKTGQSRQTPGIQDKDDPTLDQGDGQNLAIFSDYLQPSLSSSE